MANALYPKWKEALLQGSSDSTLNGTVKAALIDTGVTGLPVTPNGGNITAQWNASGIFRIGA